MKRILYAIQNGWTYRQKLSSYITQPALSIEALQRIQMEDLEKLNVAVLVLDFDGVLAPHDAATPTQAAEKWLRTISMNLGEQRIAILSNKPKPVRRAYFQEHFPGIQWVEGTRSKPYPDGILEVAESRGIVSSRILIVDDRLLTGILASCIAPCQARYFIKPVMNFSHHPIKESFFWILRKLERYFFRRF